jgi:hypothetical protein
LCAASSRTHFGAVKAYRFFLVALAVLPRTPFAAII